MFYDVVEASIDEEAGTSTGDGDEGIVTSTKEDQLSASTEDDIKGNNATDYVEGEATSTEEDPFSPSISPENRTTQISNSSTLESSSDNSTGGIFTSQLTDESCDLGPRSGVSTRSIEVPSSTLLRLLYLKVLLMRLKECSIS